MNSDLFAVLEKRVSAVLPQLEANKPRFTHYSTVDSLLFLSSEVWLEKPYEEEEGGACGCVGGKTL